MSLERSYPPVFPLRVNAPLEPASLAQAKGPRLRRCQPRHSRLQQFFLSCVCINIILLGMFNNLNIIIYMNFSAKFVICSIYPVKTEKRKIEGEEIGKLKAFMELIKRRSSKNFRAIPYDSGRSGNFSILTILPRACRVFVQDKS